MLEKNNGIKKILEVHNSQSDDLAIMYVFHDSVNLKGKTRR